MQQHIYRFWKKQKLRTAKQK